MPYTNTYLEAEPTRAEVDAREGVQLLEFGAPWCPHCQGAQAAVEAFVSEHPLAQHAKIEDGRGKPLGRSFKVKLWPTLVLLLDGEELARVVRPITHEDLEPLRAAMVGG
ncbi:putative thioredoxin [Pseudoxanthomonas suwonensis 11-1]|uniref:Putative thioredoxin n=1 Tax=Pseudoxanthomonas suwonensis (strain 11-1) TaxID=743721 RepID=E6WV24_PSEUU|nr:thioredoxin family protein [Pseudoxanthomonas suwonensis]ADV28023.1 putative thioredoxin [Pseudoxanthomonas suwonensis 11-1]